MAKFEVSVHKITWDSSAELKEGLNEEGGEAKDDGKLAFSRLDEQKTCL